MGYDAPFSFLEVKFRSNECFQDSRNSIAAGLTRGLFPV